MSTHYDHNAIEKKWQQIWEKNRFFEVAANPQKEKCYVLDMFPYPSGAGLHVGHVTGYTATDIISRYLRTKGYNVLHPIGWDSFGLPAEQYAIRTGIHPAITTQKNISAYRLQLKAMGFSYDWSREINTSDAYYYKWTQWIFTKLYERGLAYEAYVPVNFCPALGTVLANEEIEGGQSIEGGHPIERRPLRQWVLKITDYADRLIEDLDLVDWPESLKRLQINWIGKSVGVEIKFVEETSKCPLTIFTTRPETIFGATYLVISPEHPVIDEIVPPSRKKTMQTYLETLKTKTDRERAQLSEVKMGVDTGSFAINPLNQEKIPIWVGDYILMGYGTGIVMGVPAHDERDYEFARQNGLPIRAVIESSLSLSTRPILIEDKDHMIESSFLNGLTAKEAREAVINYLIERGVGKQKVHYKLRDWLFSRQRYWGEPFPILHFEDGSKRLLDLDELPLTPPEISNYLPSVEGESPLSTDQEWAEIVDHKTGKKAHRETNTMPQWAGSCWYYLRFCDPQNKTAAWDREKERYWLPVDLYVGGAEHAVLHLLYARFWHKVLYDCGLVSTPEPFKKCRNQGLVMARSYQFPNGAYVDPKEVFEKEGSFYHLETGTPLQSQIEKMSKSKLNGVAPDDIISMYGADTLRLYAMFMGPFEQEKLWNSDSVQGCYRFLNRFYQLVRSNKVTHEEVPEALKLVHRTAVLIEKDIQDMSFNTAIAKLMECLNGLIPLPKYPKPALKILTQLLYPFAPHIAEETWEFLGETETLTFASFPRAHLDYLTESTALYIVQINGKTRGKLELPRNQTQETLMALIQERPEIAKHLTGQVEKIIYIPDKLINLVLHA